MKKFTKSIKKGRNMSKKIGNIKLYTLSELHKKLEDLGLKVTPLTLRKYIRTGKLKGVKMGTRYVVTEDSLKEFFETKHQK